MWLSSTFMTSYKDHIMMSNTLHVSYSLCTSSTKYNIKYLPATKYDSITYHDHQPIWSRPVTIAQLHLRVQLYVLFLEGPAPSSVCKIIDYKIYAYAAWPLTQFQTVNCTTILFITSEIYSSNILFDFPWNEPSNMRAITGYHITGLYCHRKAYIFSGVHFGTSFYWYSDGNSRSPSRPRRL